jgi:hypothetical protein
MSCKCPVCGRNTTTVGTLFSHIVNIHDPGHERWLNTYCRSNNIDLTELLRQRALDNKDANKPLTAVLKRDFCS